MSAPGLDPSRLPIPAPLGYPGTAYQWADLLFSLETEWRELGAALRGIGRERKRTLDEYRVARVQELCHWNGWELPRVVTAR